MDIKIKKANLENLQDIQKLNLKLFENEIENFDDTLKDNWSFSREGEEYFRYRITADDGCVFIAIVNDEIIGYLAGGKVNGPAAYRKIESLAELENMYVTKEYRSQGVGKKLSNEFAQWCKSKNIKRIKVNASASNIKAINFYRKNGLIDYELILEMDI